MVELEGTVEPVNSSDKGRWKRCSIYFSSEDSYRVKRLQDKSVADCVIHLWGKVYHGVRCLIV